MTASGEHYPNPNADVCGNDIVYSGDDPSTSSIDPPDQPQIASERAPEGAVGILERARRIALIVLENAGHDYIARLHDPNRLT